MVFNDHAWVLTPAWLRVDHMPLNLDFILVPPSLRDTAKRLFYALLTQNTPPGELPILISSIRTYYGCVRRFLLWANRHGRTQAQITGEDLDDYHRHVVGLRLSVGATKGHRRAVRMLWAYRTRLPDRLAQDPLRRTVWQAWVRAHSQRTGKNLTDRIPEQVLGPLLTWALRWVDDFADDVLAARAENDTIDARPPAGPDPVVALHAFLDDYRRRGQRVARGTAAPGHRAPPAGCWAGAVNARRNARDDERLPQHSEFSERRAINVQDLLRRGCLTGGVPGGGEMEQRGLGGGVGVVLLLVLAVALAAGPDDPPVLIARLTEELGIRCRVAGR
ncbi:hypothetical protein OG609_43015 [Streptomyces sp. NBC_01224]|uniref:hypothetical protein n=1 Tax=Streptomyces sp. NBC_01224 TaxID=2903783 RepID=UPI002E10A4DC|nr:hypothetical protein OG609_43015 [Streptomyces sp. NBC_01224]